MPDFAPQTVRSYAALIWTIRWTCVVAAIFMAIFLLFILVVPLMVFFKAIADVSNPLGYRFTMAFFGLILILFYGVVVKRNLHNFPKDFGKVNANAMANFSSIFALLLAFDWYHSLPPHLPKVIADYCEGNAFLATFVEDDPGLTYRGVLSIIAFILFYKLIKAYLLQTLGFNTPNPPQNPPFIDPDIPEYPQKSPPIQL